VNSTANSLEELSQGEDLEGLFTLYTNPDGSTRAEYGLKTAPHLQRLAWGKLGEGESSLAWGLALASSLRECKVTDPEFLKLPLEMIQQALGADLETLTDPETGADEKKKARRTLMNRFETALDALEKKNARPPHAAAATLPVTLHPSGDTREMPLAWVALEMARTLAEENRALPTKGEVREAVEKEFSEQPLRSETAWREVWKEAGLEALPQWKPHDRWKGK
jgi:hypothetical protein